MEPYQLFDTQLSPLDRQELRHFFASEVGKRVLRNVLFFTPAPTDAAGDLTFRAGAAKGWKDAVTHLMELASAEAASASPQDKPLVLIDSPDEMFDPKTHLPR